MSHTTIAVHSNTSNTSAPQLFSTNNAHWSCRIAALCCLVLPAATLRAQLLSGYTLEGKQLTGPVRTTTALEPVWVVDYHTLTVEYHGTGIVGKDVPVLALRPGSVGPVTPRATNPENPFASGADVIVLQGKDLVLDGKPHTVSIELTGKMKTPQIDALEFALPKGTALTLRRLQFLADPGFLPCGSAVPSKLPADTSELKVTSQLTCNGVPATSLRNPGTLTISARGQQASTLYLDLYFALEGFTNYVASQPARPTSTSDPRFAIVNVRYADAPNEVSQAFPLLISEHRHVLTNRARALYAISLDPHRKLLSVELQDRSPHVQMLLFHAGLSSRNEQSLDETPEQVSTAPMATTCTATGVLSGSTWFDIAASKDGSQDLLKPALERTKSADGLKLSLSLQNTSDHDVTATVDFPSLKFHVSDQADDVSYLFPAKTATISSADRDISAEYGPNFLLQFADVFAPTAHCGAAVLTEDASGLSKTFSLSKAHGTVLSRTEYTIRIPAHGSTTLPSAEIVLHNGDWHSGFHAYERWLATWYQPHTPHPAWLGRAFYMRRDYPTGGSDLLFNQDANRYTFDKLIADGKAFGGLDFIDISGWALSDAHGRVGDYPIELGGLENFRNNIALATKNHIPTGLYFEGYLIDQNSDVGKAHGAEWQLINQDGKGAWWPHDSPEEFMDPRVVPWQNYLSNRVATVAKETGAWAVYLDEFGCRDRLCYSATHSHEVGVNVIPGEIGMARKVRESLDARELKSTIVYTECPPVDIATPYVDGTFTYALPGSPTKEAYGAKLNLWRFAFPKVQLWDMLSSGVEPHILSAEDFRLSFWHGDGVWLKGRSDTWYGNDVLNFLRWAHPVLLQHAAAFAGKSEPLVESPDPLILINRFEGGREVVYTLFNSAYETKWITFQGKKVKLGPRDVQFVSENRRETFLNLRR